MTQCYNPANGQSDRSITHSYNVQWNFFITDMLGKCFLSINYNNYRGVPYMEIQSVLCYVHQQIVCYKEVSVNGSVDLPS